MRIPADFLASLAALLVAYYLRAQENLFFDIFKKPDLGSFPQFSIYLKFAFLASLVFIILVGLLGSYSLKIKDSLSVEIRKIFSASIIGLMAVITYYFFIREFPFSRLILFYAFALEFLFVSSGRIIIKSIQRYMLRLGIGRRRIIFVGDNSITDELISRYSKSFNFDIFGSAKDFNDLQVLINKNKQIEEVIQTQDDRKQAEEIIDFCRANHFQYHFVPNLLEMHKSNIEISAFGGFPLISLRPTPMDGWGKVIKRIFDIFGSGLGLIILSPIFLLLAVAIKLDSPGTVFFTFSDDRARKIKRIGERGRAFVCLKFRTMKMGTHALRYTKLAEMNLRKGTPLVKIKDDPRITRVGAFLRRFSIDELPQLWNVFKGEMSLVGPRPHLPEEVAKYEQNHKFLLTIKPGITGLPQISGRSDLPFNEEVELDTYYIENWSLWMDIKILIKTVFVVVKPYKE